MFEENNPYDIPRSIKRDKAFSILIHSDSLSNEIKSCSGVIKTIDELNQFDEINVVFSPTKNDELRKVIEENYNSEMGIYKLENKYIVFESKNYSAVIKILLKECYEDQFKKVKNTSLDKIDLMTIVNNMFDLIILKEEDIKQLNPNKKLICEDDVLEQVRLYMLNQKLFYIKERYTTDETFYYIYKYKKVFMYYQYLWSVLCEADSELKKHKLFEYADSLSTRLEFYCRACDQTKIECLKSPNNLTASYTKYNFGYLILIMTGIYDNLAWIINDIYDMNIRKEEVGLKIPIKLLKEYKKSKFLERLTLKDKELAAFIADDLTQKYIHIIYPIRDSLVHRNFFNSIHYVNKAKGIEKNLIKVPQIIYEKVKEFGAVNIDYIDSFIILDEVYIEPYKFIELLDKIFVETVNKILSGIDLNILIDKLSLQGKQRVINSFEKYDSGLHNFFNLNYRPIYF